MNAPAKGIGLASIVALIRKEIADAGEIGPQGERGPEGERGPQGPKGNAGPAGKQGPKGNDGKQGKPGKDGKDGKDGEDGVGIEEIHQEGDDVMVITMTDGEVYEIELPKGENTEVRYNKAGGGGGGGGSVDLSNYVEKPDTDDGWMVYKLGEGWALATTDLIETNPEVTFRDSEGRFKSTKQYEELTTQLKVNRFLAGELEGQAETLAKEAEMRRTKDDFLQEQIDNIQEKGYDDTGIRDDLAQEIVDREQGDKDLDDKILAEANTRRKADEGLQSEINTLADTVANLDIPDLDGYATEEYVDNAIEGIDFPETDLTGIEDRLDSIEEVLPKEPIYPPSIEIGVVKTLVDSPDRPSGTSKPPMENLLMWHMEAGLTGNPGNEMKTQIPNEYHDNIIIDGVEAVWFKQGDKIQKWNTITGGWWTGGNLWHLSGQTTEGDDLVEGEPVEIYYEDPSVFDEELIDAISREESKADDAELRELIESIEFPETDLSDYYTKGEVDESQGVQDDKIDGLRTDLNQETIDRVKGDNQLAADIEELALILSTITNSLESGFYEYVGNSVPSKAGQFSLTFSDVTAAENIITFNEVDADGTTHNLPATVSVDDYLEIVDQEHPEQFGLWQVTAVPDGTGVFSVQVKMIRAGETFDIGDKCEARFFSVTDALDVNELDARYLKLAGGEMTGKLTTPDIEVKTRDYTSATLYLHGHRDNAGTESAQIVMHNRYHANAKGTISWLASNGNNGSFKFDDKVIFGKGQQTNANGFTVKGYVSSSAPNGDLLYVYHNNNAQDAVIYKGKQLDTEDHLATTKWTVGKIETAIGNIDFPEPDLSDYVSKTGGDEMQGPFKVTNNPEIEGGSRNSRKLEVLDVKSGSENSSLNLGAKTTSIYVGENQTTFTKPILVDNIGEKTEENNVNFLNTTTAPRVEVKTGENASEAVLLLEGHRTGTSNPAARLTMSNSENGNAYGSLSWKGVNGQGWFEFNKDLDLTNHGLHSVTRVRMLGEKAICDGNTERITVGGKVKVSRSGADTTGFTLNGRIDGDNNADLLSVYHNSGDNNDAINYFGKQDGNNNIATVGYVKSQLESGASGDFLPIDGSAPMTGTLQAPRVEIKHADFGDGVLLVTGKRDNTNAVAARVTLSNSYNSNAYGSLEWRASSSNNGYFKFTDKVKLAVEGTADDDLVTKAYVDSKAGGGSLVTYKSRMTYQTNGNVNNQFYFTDQYGAATTAQSQSKFFYWTIPNSCWVKQLTDNGVRNLGEVLIYNTSGTIMWTGSIITVQDPSNSTKIKIDTERHYGTNAWNNGSIYMVELVMAFREK